MESDSDNVLFFFSRLQPEIPIRLPKVLQAFQLFSSKLGQS